MEASYVNPGEIKVSLHCVLLQMHQKVPPFLFPFFALYRTEIQLKKNEESFTNNMRSILYLFSR